MKRKLLLILLCILFFGMAAWYSLGLFRQWREYRAGEQTYQELSQYVRLQTPPETARPQPEAPEETTPEATEERDAPEETEIIHWPQVDFEALQAINPDVVAWIYVEGTEINYPVVQGEDNDDYLNRLFDGKRNAAGSIFMDYRNTRDLSDRNTVLYGHNMKNGSMFHQITEYTDQAFYDQHPIGLLMTPEGNYKIEFVAGYVTDMNGAAWKLEFASDEEFSLWLDQAIFLSTFAGAAVPAQQNRVITLSTCTYEYSDARYVLVGILK